MKPLDTEITHDGRTLRQLKRTAKVAIYQLTGERNLIYGYEVITIRVQKERERFGRILPEREVYPPDSEFGKLGWSFGRNHKVEAFELFNRLVREERDGLTPHATHKVLATEFRHGGRLFTQLKRDGRAALHQLSGADYEVVVIQSQRARNIPGYSFAECEVMPTPAQWGVYGWSYLAEDLAGAEQRYARLLPRWGAAASNEAAVKYHGEFAVLNSLEALANLAGGRN